MKIRLVSVFLLSLGAALPATIAVPTCSSLPTFANLIAAETCDLGGGFTAKGFFFSSEFATPQDVRVSVVSGTNELGFSLSSAKFVSSIDGLSTFVIKYTIDPQPDIISIIRGGADDAGQSGFGNFFAGLEAADVVSIMYQFCVDVPFAPGDRCDGRTFGFVLSLPDQSNTFLALANLSDFINLGDDPTNTVGVIQTITLRNGGFIQGQTGLDLDLLVDVPEPVSAALTGLGLLLVAGLRRRRG